MKVVVTWMNGESTTYYNVEMNYDDYEFVLTKKDSNSVFHIPVVNVKELEETED